MKSLNGMRAFLVPLAFLFLAPTLAHALTFDELLIDKDEVNGVCEFIEGEHPVSIQASVQFDMSGKDEAGITLYGNPKQKQFQSLSCGETNATVYYYEFPEQDDLARRLPALKKALWGEEGPSPMHPEQVLTMDQYLIVVSSRKPEFLVALLSHRTRFPNVENNLLDERLTRMHCDPKNKKEKPEEPCRWLNEFKSGVIPPDLRGREVLLLGQSWNVGEDGHAQAPQFEALYVGRLPDGTTVASFTSIAPENEDERKQILAQMEAQKTGKPAETGAELRSFLMEGLASTKARARESGGRSLAFLANGNRVYLRREGPRIILTTNLMNPAKNAPFVVATFETRPDTDPKGKK
ncbi:MAG TPA: hypothetical protein VFW45_11150 [Candidatus Polarisedimenticolia bacterium]|nr:hypothetical protein [Candidatus Polarisedimenticolia bacterium]